MAATQLGDHRFDDRLADYSPATLERQHREIREALSELARFNSEEFEVDARIDHRLMVQICRSILRDFEKVRVHRR